MKRKTTKISLKFCSSYTWTERQTDSHGKGHRLAFFNFLLWTAQKQILYTGMCWSENHTNVLRTVLNPSSGKSTFLCTFYINNVRFTYSILVSINYWAKWPNFLADLYCTYLKKKRQVFVIISIKIAARYIRSWVISVIKVSGLRHGRVRFDFWLKKRFFSVPPLTDRLWASIGSFSLGKATGREADHTPPPNANIGRWTICPPPLPSKFSWRNP
jgi:hypothetical protein